MGEDRISVIITAYNVESWIERAIKSVINQTYKNIEIVIVDDHSTDNTLQLIKKYPVKVISHDKNLGAGKARQTGIDNSTGDWIMFLDGDDWLELDSIERLLKVAHKDNSDMCGGLRNIHKDGQVIKNYLPYLKAVGLAKYKRMSDLGNYLCDFIIRRSLFDKVKYCPRRFIEDTPTAYKLLYYSNIVSYCDFIVSNYNIRSNSLCASSSMIKKNIYGILGFIDIVTFLFGKKEFDTIKDLNFIEAINQSIIKTRFNAELYPDEFAKYRREWGFILNMYNRIINKLKDNNHGL